MFFRYLPSNHAYRHALRAAIGAHNPAALQILLSSHGELAFAVAIGDFSGRVIADALSMLPPKDREGVIARLSRAAKERLDGAYRGDISLLLLTAGAMKSCRKSI